MISLPTEYDLNKYREEAKKRIIDGFVTKPNDLTKSVSVESVDKFNEKYPEDSFERYSPEAVNKFKSDFQSSGKEGEAAEDSFNKALSGLTLVQIKEEDKISYSFVKKK